MMTLYVTVDCHILLLTNLFISLVRTRAAIDWTVYIGCLL